MAMHPLSVSESFCKGSQMHFQTSQFVFILFHSLINFPVLPAPSSQTYTKHTASSVTGLVTFCGQTPTYQFAKMYVGKTYSNQHLV